MPYTMEDFRRGYVREHLKDLTPEEILASLSVEQRVAWLKERLKGLTIDQILAALSPEQIAGLRKLFQNKEPPAPR